MEKSRVSFTKLMLLAITVLFFSFLILPSSVHAAAPGKPKLVAATANGTKSVTVEWKKVNSANGYLVFRKTVDSGWTTICTANSKSVTSYVDKNVVPGTKYIYTVRSYKYTSGKRVLSKYNKTGVTATLTLAAPELVSAKHTGAYSVKVKWNSVKGAQGYYVYKMIDGSWVKQAKVKSLSWTDTDAAKGKNTYTVRAFRKNGSSTKKGKYSKSGIVSNKYTAASNYNSYVGAYSGVISSYQSASYFNFSMMHLRIRSIQGSKIVLQVGKNSRMTSSESNIIEATLNGNSANFVYRLDGNYYSGNITLRNNHVEFYGTDSELSGRTLTLEPTEYSYL